MKTKANANKTQTQWASRMEALEKAEKRRKKNLRECKALLRYVPKNGINSDTVVARIEEMLKEYVEDLKQQHEG